MSDTLPFEESMNVSPEELVISDRRLKIFSGTQKLELLLGEEPEPNERTLTGLMGSLYAKREAMRRLPHLTNLTPSPVVIDLKAPDKPWSAQQLMDLPTYEPPTVLEGTEFVGDTPRSDADEARIKGEKIHQISYPLPDQRSYN